MDSLVEAAKSAITFLTQPEYLFSIGFVGLGLFFYFRDALVEPRVVIPASLGVLVFFLLSCMNDNFYKIVTKPDNVPILMLFVFVGFFFWLAMRQASINDKRIANGEKPMEASQEPAKVAVWPNLVYTELICIILLTAGLIIWSVFLKAPLEEPADPTDSPNPSKAPWYFLGLQEMLVYFDPWLAGVVLPGLIVVGLIAIPYIDRNPKGAGYYTFADRPFAISTFCFGFLVLWCMMIILGTFLRGPNWNFFGPYEPWDVHKLVPLTNVNLSEMIWVQWQGQHLPENWLVREWPGFALIIAYFVFPPWILMKTVFKNMYLQMGVVRYQLMVFLLLSMLSLPIKMVLRWTLNLKYLVAIPEAFFNI